MKGLLVLCLAWASLSAFSMERLGGFLENRSTGEKLSLICIDQFDLECSDAIFVVDGESLNDSLIIPLGDYDQARWDRWGLFETIIAEASTARAPVLFPWYIVNMRTVTKKLRRVFQLMIDPSMKDKFEVLSNKNFQNTIKAIEVR
jgi:hypothetical protein